MCSLRSECKRQTDGYIGSEFKSFNKVEDALAYMKGESSSRSNYGTYHETYYETNYETSRASAHGLGHGLAPPVTYGSTHRSHYRAHCRAGYAETSGVGPGGSRSVRSIGSPPKSAISTMRDIPKTAIEWLPKRVTTTQYQTNDGMNVVVKQEFKALQKASKGKTKAVPLRRVDGYETHILTTDYCQKISSQQVSPEMPKYYAVRDGREPGVYNSWYDFLY
ncbi:unnamed protein product [Oppiella nova]|uniref:Ribonuclease H1 N-terminal domain-containing protein n=1 Tax=Oppiella nova TaxID=334625 RepID=A0A7R9QNW5_9ACAR|nr:unnamed protein product [Oppiella nova]CAG2170166.1 unnamed protein product [Oppiella nova]